MNTFSKVKTARRRRYQRHGLAVARMVLEAGGSVVLTGNKRQSRSGAKELSPLGPVCGHRGEPDDRRRYGNYPSGN